ncbi:MAG: hypothetical protein V2A76_16515 [Planctomycetota bacterium]
MARPTTNWILRALLLVAASGCSGIEGDLDLSPLFRTAQHPNAGYTDTDALGPLLTHVTDGSTSEFGIRPLFMTTTRPWRGKEGGEDEVVTSFIAPFGKYHSNPRTTQFRFWPLLWYTRERTGAGGIDTDFLFFPLLLTGTSTPPPGAEGAGERSEGYFALFPLIGQVNSFVGYDKFQFLAWPLLQRLTKQVFDEEEAFTSVALLFGFTTGAPRGGSWHLLPLYYQSAWTYPPFRAPQYPEGADPSKPLPRYDKRSYLWPFVHYQKLQLDRGPGKETELFAIWPLFKREKSYDHEFWTILWPLFRYNVERPLDRESGQAAQTEEAGTGEDNLLMHILSQAVFNYERTQDYLRRRFLLLLYADYTSLPTSRRNRIDSIAILQPIGYWSRSAQRLEADGGYRDDSVYVLAPFFQTSKRSYLAPNGKETGATDRFTKLWLVFSYQSREDGFRDISAIPLLPLRIEKYVKDFNDAFGVFLNLYRYERAPKELGGYSRHTVFMNLVKAYSDEHESSLSIPLLFTTRTVTEKGITRYSRRFLSGLFGWGGADGPDGQSSRSLLLFWIPIDFG